MKILLIIGFSTLLFACGGDKTTDPSAYFKADAAFLRAQAWQPGTFADKTIYKGKCSVPRSGVDFNGNRFPDKQGTLFDEKMWLRSWSNDTYLWYSEINDQNPSNYDSPVDYFDILKTEQLTASGIAKDNFHFSQSTEEYQSFSQTGALSGYGINWSFINREPPRNLRVSSIEDNTSAADNSVQRGDQLIRINGIDFVDSDQVDSINDVLFPENINTQTAFVFLRNDGSEFSVNLSSGDFAKSFVSNTKVIDSQSGRVGYIRFNGFQRPAQTPLIDAFQHFVDQNVTQLILDLRYNGGGLLAMASQLSYMIAGPNQINNSIFETQHFNDKYPQFDPVTGNLIRPTPFYEREIDFQAGFFTNRQLPDLGLTKVYVITTDNSCSASEALINGLRGIDVDVVQIGGATCGKPYGFYPTDNCGTTYFTIQFQGKNDKGFGDYADGFKPALSPNFDDELPGCSVDDDFLNPLGSEQEAMLSTALFRLQQGTCPVANIKLATKALSQRTKSGLEQHGPLSIFDPRYRAILLENSINTPVNERGDHE